MNLFKKVIKVLVIAFLASIVIFCTLPFILPVNQTQSQPGELPFANSHFATIQNVSIHYRVYNPVGDSVKGNILLIHGFSGSTFSWRNNADTLAANGYRVVSVDMPGFGFSDRAQGLNHASGFNAGLFWQLLDSISTDSWIIAGHSMGAGPALDMECLRPGKTKALIFVDGAFAFRRNIGTGGILAGFITSSVVKRWAEVLGRAYFFKTSKIEQLLRSAYSSSPDSVAVAGYLRPLMLKNTASCILDLAESKETVIPEISQVHVPVLAIWGKQDTWAPYNRWQKFLEKLPALQTVLIDGAGHCPMETRSAQFNSAVINFVDTVGIQPVTKPNFIN